VSAVGIRGLGVAFPEQVRTNDWWSPEVVGSWRSGGSSLRPAPTAATPNERAVLSAMADYRSDPFQGAVSRHVLEDGLLPSSLGVRAAQNALDDAGLDAQEIDLLLVHASVPDHLDTNVACTIHSALGMKNECFSLSVEAACNSWQANVELAIDMIRAGRARTALIAQWCAVTRLLPPNAPYAPWFGDGGSAVVLGAVKDGYGIVGRAHRSDGSLQNTLVAGVPGGSWWDAGKVVLYPENFDRAKQMFVRSADMADDVVGAALVDARLERRDVDFYACHQGTAWLRRVTQEAAGLGGTKSVDTFSWTGNLGSPNLPVVLHQGRKNGLLRDGDVVVTHAGGSGITYSSLVMRWGTGD
jgi:3-oxoacyl-[acyl-carrier-protein] synthase-3